MLIEDKFKSLLQVATVFCALVGIACAADSAPNDAANPETAKQPAFMTDPKTGVKLDTRFLPSNLAKKAIYRSTSSPIVVTGEVVDAWCYASQTMGAGHGPVHKACAVACVGGGITPGILDDQGKLWLCVKSKAYQGCRDLLFPFVAKRVTVTGWEAHHGGTNVLRISKVELATK